MFKLIKDGNLIAKELLITLTNDKASNAIFASFSKAILIYNNNKTKCDELILQYNALTIEERKQFYAEIDEVFKPVFLFLTLDGRILDTPIKF
jgi:hypothetical protein